MTVEAPPAPPQPAPVATPPMGPRRGWAAAALSFLAPGIGHVYAGRGRRAAAAAAASLVVSVAGLAASMAAGTPALRIAALSLVPLALLGVMADAWRTARRADPALPRRRYQRAWVYVLLALLAAFAVQPLLRAALVTHVQAFSLKSDAMSPTLRAGDYFLVGRRGVRVERGAVVMYLSTYADQPTIQAVTRIAAVGGDTVAMRDGVLTVNGVPERGRAPIPRPQDGPVEGDWQRAHLVGDTAGYAPTLLTWGPLAVPAGHVFMVSDNRAASLDSRYLGFIPLQDVTGQPEWIYLSREPLTGGIRWTRIGRSIR